MSPEKYVASLPTERQEAVKKLREIINKNIPAGFSETISSGMIAWVVPHSTYPAGYHCNPEQPLPFACLASQKSHIALYHMGVYADPELLNWFQKEYAAQSPVKLDMGKSCIRFKKPEHIPYKLIGELMKKINVKQWIEAYERNLKGAKV